jgi:hypothetical protein
MKDEIFLAWAAGFFDGEGCVMVEVSKEKRCKHGYRTSLHANVTQTSLPCLHLFLERFGGSIQSTENRTPNGRRWAVQHRWLVRNENAIEFLKAILPYLVVKKTQVETALSYPMRSPDGRKYGNASNPIPDDVMAARMSIRNMLQDIRASMKTMAKPPKEKQIG